MPDHLETGAVTDAVDQDHAVCPLKLLVTDGFSRFAALERQNSKIKITLTSPSKHDPKNLHECIQVVKMIQIGFNIFHQGKKKAFCFNRYFSISKYDFPHTYKVLENKM